MLKNKDSHPQFDSLSDWLQWLGNTRPETEIELGLGRIAQAVRNAGLRQPVPYIITVAGTNGKGSTVALLESILLQAGYKVGSYTSPHIHRFNERIKINGQEVGDKQLTESFAKIDQYRGSTWLTYFEFAVMVAADCFQKEGVDIALMEVGLGGRLDATNIFDPNVSVITTVDLDHQDWLGDTVEKIAREKAGIMRTGVPAIYGDLNIPQSIIDHAVEVEVPLYRRGKEFNFTVQKSDWSWRGLSANGSGVSEDKLPMPELVIDNAATVLQVVKLLPYPVSYDDIRKGIARAHLPGRYTKRVVRNKNNDPVGVVFDVAHNPQAARRLREKLEQDPVPGKTRALIAMYRDKDYKSVVEILVPVIDEWYVSEFDSPRALPASELKDVVVACGGSVDLVKSVETATQNLGANDRLLIVGSFQTVSMFGV